MKAKKFTAKSNSQRHVFIHCRRTLFRTYRYITWLLQFLKHICPGNLILKHASQELSLRHFFLNLQEFCHFIVYGMGLEFFGLSVCSNGSQLLKGKGKKHRLLIQDEKKLQATCLKKPSTNSITVNLNWSSTFPLFFHFVSVLSRTQPSCSVRNRFYIGRLSLLFWTDSQVDKLTLQKLIRGRRMLSS